jgi:hypothetical protein
LEQKNKQEKLNLIWKTWYKKTKILVLYYADWPIILFMTNILAERELVSI